MSNHKCLVVPVELTTHPNADSLSVVRVGGWQVVVKTDEWKARNRGVYIPPDSVVPDTPEFAWLGGQRRIKAKRFRKVLSYGLLVPAPDGSAIGDDMAGAMGIEHYEPPLPMSTAGEAESPPAGWYPIYDVESLNNFPNTLVPGEDVIITEKIHGASARYCWRDGRMWVSSRKEWKRASDSNLYWQCLKQHPDIEMFCRAHEGLTVYGEVFGKVQDLRYGANGGQLFFAAFDMLRGDTWLPWDEAWVLSVGFISTVPLLYRGPWDEQVARDLAELDSKWPGADHIREGVVIRADPDRINPDLGRVQLKLVSGRYLER